MDTDALKRGSEHRNRAGAASLQVPAR
ncbi:hypothetical protein CBM2626_B120324 [Cupriavidus taiwanensis]|nr:hypothetical protein CBM2626_B120324 [Cupriavidus taiwanensis]